MSGLVYELWDFDSGNRVATFASRQEALAVVREIFERDGPRAVKAFELGAIREGAAGDAEMVHVLDSDQLLALVADRPATHPARGGA